MQLVEQHVIERDDARFALIDAEAFKAKNLYNAALYLVRQTFIFHHQYLNYSEVDKLMQPHEAYRALPAKVAQQVLRGLEYNWKSYFAACQSYQEDPSKFLGHPCLPKYKDKLEGRHLLVYTAQAISQRELKQGLIQSSMLAIAVKTRQTEVHQVRIVPRQGYYVVEVIYERKEQHAKVDPKLYAGLDLGVNNLVALTSIKPGFVPILVNGRSLKSVNQYYNKRCAKLQKKLGKTGTTKRMQRLTKKRNRRIQHEMHVTSKQIVDVLVQEGIGTVVIGKNPEWKQAVEMGKQNNQNFVQIPHARFIEMLSYKATLVGIRVMITEESYTSKASFLDRDPIPDYDPKREMETKFSGRRVKRGLYRASGKRYLNADVNGSYNIIRKVAPKCFEGVEDFVVHPTRIAHVKQTKTRVI